MKVKLFSLLGLSALLTLPALATVSIEFQLGGIEAPAGSIGVLVADASVTDNNVFTVPTQAVGATLSVGSKIGSDDVIVAVFSNSNLPDWGAQKGFAEHFAVLDYAALEVLAGIPVEAGDALTLHVFPDRNSGDSIRTGEPHLSYRTGDLQQLSNSNMGFTLPADGGAYLLAALASGNGGNADLSGVDITDLPYDGGGGVFNRSLSQTARHTYFFQLDQPGFLALEGTGGAALRAELRGPDGQLIASSNGGTFDFFEELVAGLHTLVLYQNAGSGNLAYGLDFSDADTRVIIPDLAVGKFPTSLTGNNVLGGAPGQVAILSSAKANRVSGYATVANRGGRLDTLAVSGTRGNTFCAIAYFSATGSNLTASLVSGAYRTPEIDSSDAAGSIRVQFTPNKRKIVSKVGRRTVIKKKTFSTQLRASSTQGPSVFDSATLSAKTR